MPLYMDTDTIGSGVTAADVATAHLAALLAGGLMNGRFTRRMVAVAAAAVLSAGLVAAVPLFGSPAGAATPSCADPVTAGPTGPAVVSAASTPYGKVLVIGTGDYAGCSLYVLTSDELNTLTGADYACSNNANALGAACDTILWPALLTAGPPIAGPGVNPTLLGTVTRTDLISGEAVQQVTYDGLPLYRFVFDETPGETEGANLFDPVTTAVGTWYLVEPSRGRVAPGTAHLQAETVGDRTVLAVSMDDNFSLSPHTSFPVYTLSTDSRRGPSKSTCAADCAQTWQPVLTTGRPKAGAGVGQHELGITVRPDGTHQVTYDGRPLYLYAGDAYITGLPYGSARITGDGTTKAGSTGRAIDLP